ITRLVSECVNLGETHGSSVRPPRAGKIPMKSTIFMPAPLFQCAQAGHFQALAAWQPIDKPLHSTKL
ncbi:hypothetical protein, partial [Verminephrobacter eiseniae]|uniref:hypothetical protein n=1 Tax=Verminephrobacter eiseniae TaxID=364317 RepID=UPI002244F1F6